MLFRSLVFVIDDGDDRFSVVAAIFVQGNGEWSRKDFAVAIARTYISSDLLCELMYYTLVGGIGRLHIVNLPVNLFCQLAVRQGVDIIDCIFFLEVVLFAIIRAAFSC